VQGAEATVFVVAVIEHGAVTPVDEVAKRFANCDHSLASGFASRRASASPSEIPKVTVEGLAVETAAVAAREVVGDPGVD